MNSKAFDYNQIIRPFQALSDLDLRSLLKDIEGRYAFSDKRTRLSKEYKQLLDQLYKEMERRGVLTPN